MVFGLPATGLAEARWFGMRAEVHVRGVEPDKEGGSCRVLLLDEVLCRREELFIDCFHALSRQRAGVLDLLTALAVGPAVQHAARSVVLPEVREVLLGRIVAQLRLLLGVE